MKWEPLVRFQMMPYRANPVVKGYRDVINIRVKPTLNKVNSYLDKKHTTSFETSGSVNPNPEVR